MVFQHIEQLKRQYTDRFVVVDESRPELRRFAGAVGRVKTVNMSGRALVEFNRDANIGWYDIAPEFLKVVERPVPKPPEAKKKPAKPAAATTPAAKKEPTAKPPGKLSTADILAAARGKPAAAPAEQPAPKNPVGKMSTEDILAAARGGKPATPPPEAPPKKPAAKMSTEDILSAARGGTKPAAPPSEPSPVEAEEKQPVTPAESPAAQDKPSTDRVDRSKMSVEDILAWCRAHDGG